MTKTDIEGIRISFYYMLNGVSYSVEDMANKLRPFDKEGAAKILAIHTAFEASQDYFTSKLEGK